MTAKHFCSKCGGDADPTYSEPYKSRMIERKMCFICSHWTDYDIKLASGAYAKATIIEGNVYGPGSRTSGSFRGMTGRRFDIEYLAPSIHAGKRITTFDLWSGGVMPDWLRERWPDTAKFLNGAERVDIGADREITTCWNGSTGTEHYPLPNTLEAK